MIECRRLIFPMPEYLRSEDHDQPKAHVNHGNTGKEGCDATLDVMKDGQEPEMFIVQDLLQIWRRIVHEH